MLSKGLAGEKTQLREREIPQWLKIVNAVVKSACTGLK